MDEAINKMSRITLAHWSILLPPLLLIILQAIIPENVYYESPVTYFIAFVSVIAPIVVGFSVIWYLVGFLNKIKLNGWVALLSIFGPLGTTMVLFYVVSKFKKWKHTWKRSSWV